MPGGDPAGRFYTANNLLGLLGAGNTMGELVPARTDTPSGRVGGSVALILDDVGAEEALPYVAQGNQEGARHALYFQLVNYCYEREISLVVTDNLQIHELAAWIGRRAWWRLNEMAPARLIVSMTGVPDYRRIEAHGRPSARLRPFRLRLR